MKVEHATIAEAGILPLAELDRVELLIDQSASGSPAMPVGSTGTVVAIWNKGAYYEIAFRSLFTRF